MIARTLYFFTLVLAIATSDFICPSQEQTFHSHLTRCAKFIECNNGLQTEHDCISGLVFSPESGFCDFPEHVDCVDVEDETEPDIEGSGSGEQEGGPVGECPAENGEFVDFLTHSTDCTIYYMCNWGVPIQMNCPDGLHFNPTLNVCDWPWDAGCTADQ